MFQKSYPYLKLLKKSSLILLLVVMTVSLLSACGSNAGHDVGPAEETIAPVETAAVEVQEEPSTKVVIDEQDHELTIPAKPLKVFAPYMEDSLLSIGVKPVVQWADGGVGQKYLQDQLQDVPLANFAGGLPPSPEVVMAFEPDLIILHNAFYAENGVYENYSKIAPTYVFNNAAGDLESSITKLGELLGKPEEAVNALSAYEQKKEEAKAKLAPVVDGKNAVLINFNGKGMYLIGGNYFGGYVLSHELGIGKSKLLETANSLDASLEILPDLDADFIFTINYGGTGTANIMELTDNAIWKSMPAAKNENVFEVSDQYWTGSGLIAYGKMIDDVVALLAP